MTCKKSYNLLETVSEKAHKVDDPIPNVRKPDFSKIWTDGCPDSRQFNWPRLFHLFVYKTLLAFVKCFNSGPLENWTLALCPKS